MNQGMRTSFKVLAFFVGAGGMEHGTFLPVVPMWRLRRFFCRVLGGHEGARLFIQSSFTS